MLTNTDILTKAYDAGVDEEWERLTTLSGQAEFELIKQYLTNYVNEKSIVYDIGCGPGRYSEFLLEKHCKVAAIDLSQKSLDAFRLRINGHFKENLIFSRQCCATRLEWSEPESADIILLMGPMYHLIDEDERMMALNHCWRILRNRGILFSVFLNVLPETDCYPTDYQITKVVFQGFEVEQFRCTPNYASIMLESHFFRTEKFNSLDNDDYILNDNHSFNKNKPILYNENYSLACCKQFLVIAKKISK